MLNYYVVSVTISHLRSDRDAIFLHLHGPFDNGYDMESCVIDQENVGVAIQRIVVSDSEIFKLKGAYRPGNDGPVTSFVGSPTTNGYYWVVAPNFSDRPIHALVMATEKLYYVHGNSDGRPLDEIVKYKPTIGMEEL